MSENAPAPDNPPAPAAPVPPAAKAVLDAPVREEDAIDAVKLKRDLADERSGRKKDQTRLSELEDENRRLKTPPTPTPAKKPKGWLDNATFWDNDD